MQTQQDTFKHLKDSFESIFGRPYEAKTAPPLTDKKQEDLPCQSRKSLT